MEAKKLISCIENGDYDKVILDVYVDESKVEYQKNRYVNTINEYIKAFGNADVEIYSAPATITGDMLTTVACATIKSDKAMLEALGRDVTPDYLK